MTAAAALQDVAVFVDQIPRMWARGPDRFAEFVTVMLADTLRDAITANAASGDRVLGVRSIVSTLRFVQGCLDVQDTDRAVNHLLQHRAVLAHALADAFDSLATTPALDAVGDDCCSSHDASDESLGAEGDDYEDDGFIVFDDDADDDDE